MWHSVLQTDSDLLNSTQYQEIHSFSRLGTCVEILQQGLYAF